MCRDFAAILVAWGLRAYGGDPGMIGLEPTLEEHIANLVAVFREVRRVLRPDGTVWLNYGDAYARGENRGSSGPGAKQASNRGSQEAYGQNLCGLKPKDLMLLPARVALALQADGWWLRSEIVWAKPNPMPESVTDRPTSAHEKVFLLTKQSRYFYDAEAVRMPRTPESIARDGRANFYEPETPPGQSKHSGALGKAERGERELQPTANLRNVWTIPTHGYSEAHFATFPPALVEPCIKAGTSEKGCCVACGAPWRRVVKRTTSEIRRSERTREMGRTRPSGTMTKPPTSETTGWQPTCECEAETQPCVVLDPFAGAGTVGLVADRQEYPRDAILIEINAEYAEMARRRIQGDAPLFTKVA